jgi:hypothetical protein
VGFVQLSDAWLVHPLIQKTLLENGEDLERQQFKTKYIKALISIGIGAFSCLVISSEVEKSVGALFSRSRLIKRYLAPVSK